MENTPILLSDYFGYITTILVGVVALYLKTKLVGNESKLREMQDFFSLDKPTTKIPESIPPTEYIMQNSVKRVIMSGKTPEDRITLLEQIDSAESVGKWAYTIKCSRGYYYIKWGLIAGGEFDNTD